jgi:hypothetical protein
MKGLKKIQKLSRVKVGKGKCKRHGSATIGVVVFVAEGLGFVVQL